jgi:hypothetical protein
LQEHEDLQAALKDYQKERRTALLVLQRAAHNTATWFENIQCYVDQEALQFAYSLAMLREGKTAPADGISWRYPLRLAIQKIAMLRRLRRWVNSAKRELRAVRRG